MTAIDGTGAQSHYSAVSMRLAAYLDEQYVAMHILTDTGQTISVVCPRDSIFAVQRHIEQIGRQCPEIATWRRPDTHEASAETTLRGSGGKDEGPR
jgi:hypothetical protein